MVSTRKLGKILNSDGNSPAGSEHFEMTQNEDVVVLRPQTIEEDTQLSKTV